MILLELLLWIENNYATGSAIVNNITYSQRGFGISFESHRVDHMEFRSERAKSKGVYNQLYP